jgi:hypothetical protein
MPDPGAPAVSTESRSPIVIPVGEWRDRQPVGELTVGVGSDGVVVGTVLRVGDCRVVVVSVGASEEVGASDVVGWSWVVSGVEVGGAVVVVVVGCTGVVVTAGTWLAPPLVPVPAVSGLT